MKRKRLNPQDLAQIGMFVALICVCAWIVIPGTVPFTLQTFAVFLAAALLGCQRGTIAIVTYVLLGVVGAPVFAGFRGGPAVLLDATGGFLIGFVVAVPVVAAIIKVAGRKAHVLAGAMLIGQIICYVLGTGWFIVLYAQNNQAVGVMTALMMCVVPYVVPDMVKIALAVLMSRKLFRFVK